ncbi:GNAT family N-acetyltransferase [Gordonia sp. ABSL11-1]|uniref:MSMEG_0567/sll0787 family protein n=1 Tax=Gordonia sp. ABSL11-1 TaxID=3053924 RepID=UPI00257239A1|nr:MSMEG_0567/sll0787 family protein [Gordonia sp. ABSL11-1]MDL9947118.1 GNAT family N-acetyltransferase [Gordonia sp. ABSL11-1]
MLDGTTAPVHQLRAARTDLSILAGARPASAPARFLIRIADDAGLLAAHRSLRIGEFVERQGLFDQDDRDDADDDPRTVVLVATAPDGTVIGGVRVAPCTDDDIGWWAGSRLVVADPAHAAGVGAALVRAACAHAESAGVARFDATVQDRYVPMFRSLGWQDRGAGPTLRGRDHRRMMWPIGQIQRAADSTKAMLAEVLSPFSEQPGGLGPSGFRGDDGVPIPGSELIAACDAIIPAMVERDPEWAGWCSILVNMNDLTAMGARPLGVLDAVGAPTRSHLTRIIRGIASAAQAWRTPVLGGHTQVGVHASLSVTAFGHAERAIPAGAGRVGDIVSMVADLGGSWRPGYHGRQWDSTSSRTADELTRMARLPAELRPAAAKDVSMAGIAGTLGMLAEASGTGAELDVAAIPRPRDAAMGSWLTCFPGYAMLMADRLAVDDVPGPTTSAGCGRLTAEPGVRLRWPDGEVTVAVTSTVTGLGAA